MPVSFRIARSRVAVFGALLGLPLGTVVAPAAMAQTAASTAPIVHQFTGTEADALANSYLIETAQGVIVVDGLMTEPTAKTLRARLDSMNKPLLAVIVTHGHPDHYGGVAAVVEGKEGVPVYAAEGVTNFLKMADGQIGTTLRGYGIPFPEKRVLPDHPVKSGESVTIGGLQFTVQELGPGESNADAIWILNGPKKVAFIGDTAYNGTHVYLADGHSAAYLKNLGGLKKRLSGVTILYPGHGAPGGTEMIDYTRRYVEAFRKNVAELSGGSGKLADAQKGELARRMAVVAPGDRLPQFVMYGADAVAAEEAAETKSAASGRK